MLKEQGTKFREHEYCEMNSIKKRLSEVRNNLFIMKEVSNKLGKKYQLINQVKSVTIRSEIVNKQKLEGIVSEGRK